MNLPPLKIFVYGTLKRGFRNHELMEGYSSVEESHVVGRLLIPEHGRYPYLKIARREILAYGTADTVADLQTQGRIGRALESYGGLRAEADGRDWFSVVGELYTYRDGRAVLPRLDDLEQFDAHHSSASNYHRVLARVGREGSRIAWLYTVPESRDVSGLSRCDPPWLWDRK